MNVVRVMVAILSLFSALGMAANCSQESRFNLTPSIADVPNNTGGLLSSNWHAAYLLVGCSGFGGSYVLTNAITPAGTDSGKTFLFEGVTYKLYTTSDSDVFYFGAAAGPDGILRSFGTPYSHGLFPPDNVGFKVSAAIIIRFYSTSKSLTPGVHIINSAALVNGRLTSYGGFNSAASMNLSGFSFVVKGPSCTLTTPAELKLKSVNLSALPRAGSTVEAARFQLGLVCAGSTPAYKVSYSMIDINRPGNQSSTLTLASSATQASGVSLQIVDGATPVQLGATSARMFGSIPSGGGMIGKTLNVLYIRTEGAARPGSVNAGVTVTLSYK